jgi:hypothetical protein
MIELKMPCTPWHTPGIENHMFIRYIHKPVYTTQLV